MTESVWTRIGEGSCIGSVGARIEKWREKKLMYYEINGKLVRKQEGRKKSQNKKMRVGGKGVKNKMLTLRIENSIVRRLDEIIKGKTVRKTRGAVIREILNDYVLKQESKNGNAAGVGAAV